MTDLKARVLLVSDSHDDLAAMQAALAGIHNLLVASCKPGQELLDYLSQYKVAAIVLDLGPSLNDNFEAACQIRSNAPASSPPILIIATAAAASAYADQAFDLGAVDFIEKPFHVKGLRARIGFLADLYLKSKELERRNHQASQNSEKHNAQLLDISLDAVIGTNETNRVIYWNQRAEEIFGWTKADALGHEVTTLIIPERLQADHKAGVKRFVATGVPRIHNRRIETSAVRKSGEEFPVELTVTSIKEGPGYFFYSFIRDISEQVRSKKATEEHLAAKQEVISNLETMTEGFMAFDRKYVVTYANHESETFLSMPKEEILGKAAEEIFPAADWLKFQAHYDEIMRTGVPDKFVESYLGRILQVHAYRARNGGVSIFFRDVTEQKQIEEMARSESDRLSLIANAIPDLIAYVGKDGRYKFANAAYEKWLQKAPQDVIGKTMREVLGDHYPFSEPHIEKVMKGEHVRFEGSLSVAGNTLHLAAHYIPDVTVDGSLRGFVIVAHDVTEILESREIMQNQSRYLEGVLNRIQAAVMLVDPMTSDVKFANEYAQLMTGGLQRNINSYGDDYHLLDSDGRIVPRAMYPRARAARGEKISGLEYTWVTPKGAWDYLMYSDLIPAIHGQPATALVNFLDITALKRTERSLREKELEFRVLSNSIPQLAWMADPDGFIFWFNDRWYEYTGKTREDMEGWGWQSVHDPAILPEVLKTFKTALETGEPGAFEFPLRSHTGEFRWFLTRWLPLKDPSGKVLRWFGTNTDVHEQRLIREDQRFRANFTSQLNAARDVKDLAAFATHALGQYLSASRCFLTEINDRLASVHTDYSSSLPSLQGTYDLMDFGPEMVAAWRTGKVILVDDVTVDPRTAAHASSHLDLGIRAFVTIPLIRANELVGALNLADSGTRSWVQREAELTQLVGEVIWAALERVRLLEALQESTNRSNFLSSASAVLNTSLDVDHVLKAFASVTVPAFADWCFIYMKQPDGVLKQTVMSQKDPEKVKWAQDLTDQYPPNQKFKMGLYEVLRSGRSMLMSDVSRDLLEQAATDDEHREKLLGIHFRSCMCVPMSVRGEVLGVVSVASTSESERHFSERDLVVAEELASRAALAIDNARLFKEAQNLNRLKDEFLASLSHELRTPMSVIKGNAELLKDESESLPSEVALAIDAIYRNAEAQSEIISDLLDVSSIIAGKVSCNPVEIAPMKIISEILDGLRPHAELKRVRLDLVPEHWPQIAYADPTRLHQILWNLISNAIKFTGSGGTVTISAGRTDAMWAIIVKDTGIGIEPEFLPYVFDRFRQEDASNARKFGGLGLGLSISKNLVELHGGTLHVESAGRGHGAQFTVRLPLHIQVVPKLAGKTVADRQVDLDIRGRKILLVEDSRDNRLLVVKLLARAGAEVVEAESPARAREILQSFQPDVIVSDISMPEEDGMEFIRKLRNSDQRGLRQIPAVALTAYARQEEQEAALKAGFQAHVAKPVSPGKLLLAIQEALAARDRLP